MTSGNLSRRAGRVAGIVGGVGATAGLALSLASAPATAYPYTPTGWNCLAPFVNFTNAQYPNDPPSTNFQVSSLAVGLAHDGDLEARAGKTLRLDGASVTFDQKDNRILDQLWVRTATNVAAATGAVPVGTQTGDTVPRALAPIQVAVGTTVAGPADQTLTGLGTVAKPVVGSKWWSFTVNHDSDPTTASVDPAPATPVVAWYSDGPVTNAATGQFKRTYYTEAAAYASKAWNVPKDAAGNAYPSVTYAVGHKYLTHTGDTRFPVSAAVAIEATNTVEGVQTVQVDGSWLINVVDSTPGTINDPTGYADGNHTVSAPVVKLRLPTSKWTPTGAGPVTFRLAAPGSLEGVTTRSTGYDRPGYNRALKIQPWGNVWVRFETESYGSANDCVFGDIEDGDTAVPYSPNNATSMFGDARPVAEVSAANPDASVGDVENAGFYKNNSGAWTPAFGAAGRWDFRDTVATRPVIAVAPLAVAPTPETITKVVTNTVTNTVTVPAATPPKKAAVKTLRVSTGTLKRSKKNTLSLKVANPNAAKSSFRVTVTTKSKYRVGGRTRTVTVVARTGKWSVGANGSRTVSLKLSAQGRALLKTRKSVKVKVAVSAVGSSAKGATKTLTLKR